MSPSPKNLLQEWADRHRRPKPAYDTQWTSGLPHVPMWRCTLRFEGRAVMSGEHSSKARAEMEAAELMLKAIGPEQNNSHQMNNDRDRSNAISGYLSNDVIERIRNHVVPARIPLRCRLAYDAVFLINLDTHGALLTGFTSARKYENMTIYGHGTERSRVLHQSTYGSHFGNTPMLALAMNLGIAMNSRAQVFVLACPDSRELLGMITAQGRAGLAADNLQELLDLLRPLELDGPVYEP